MSAPLNIPRSALLSVLQTGVGGLLGGAIDTAFPGVQADESTTQLLIEIAAQGALIGLTSAISGRTWIRSTDPDEQAGDGMFFMGLVLASPELQAKIAVVLGRAKVFGRNVWNSGDVTENKVTDSEGGFVRGLN